LRESSDGYGWWQTPTMGKPLKRFAFFANFFILRVETLIPMVETVGYVFETWTIIITPWLAYACPQFIGGPVPNLLEDHQATANIYLM
jgi:hypothetical protein